MPTLTAVHSARVKHLVEAEPRAGGAYVLYWMQASQRTRFNHALEYAVGRANGLGLPVLVGFGLTDDYPEANARHYLFMLQGLRDVAANLAKRGIGFVIRHGGPGDVAADLARGAAVVVCDRGYLRHQKAWRAAVAGACERVGVPVTQVETDVVVPVDVASNKREWAARTIRPKVHRHLTEFLVPLAQTKVKVAWTKSARGLKSDFDVSDPGRTLEKLKVDRSVAPVPQFFTGGENAVGVTVKSFFGRGSTVKSERARLDGYAEGRNEPAADRTSHVSAYLHFGHVSAVELALAARDSGAPAEDREAYLEELIVRRELSVNYCEHTEHYDSYDALPGWAKQTLKDHRADARPHVYSLAELESAGTADEYWNAAQREMVVTGFMHNYTRMYWGKKILEWTADPREAFERTLYLNNKYFLCGRSPNAYASVAWIFGLHDRPWGPARPVFGTVRYMNAAGLDRRFDMPGYVARVSKQTSRYGRGGGPGGGGLS